jgi:Cu+-exporting ATPase
MTSASDQAQHPPASHTRLKISGMHCAGCVNHVQKSLARVHGVQEASVNLAMEEALVTHQPVGESQAGMMEAELVQAVVDAGYQAQVIQPQANPTEQAHHDHQEPASLWTWDRLLPMILAGAVVALAMLFSQTPWARWLAWALATPVQVMVGWPFYVGACKAARHGRADMDTLVALGATVAYVYSVVALFMGQPHVYFDTAAVILVLVGLGKQLEARARANAASAIHSLVALQPPEAVVVRDGKETTIPADQVQVGDELIVRPGQRVPVDGRVTQGRSTINQALVTGESMPVEIESGSDVVAGAINQTGSFHLFAVGVGKDTFLSHVVDLVQRAQASKAKVQRIADNIASVFVPVVILIAIGSLLGWGFYDGDWTFAIMTMVAVLIVACPCALGLAVPTAIMVGTGIGARQGILIKDARALERAGRLTHVILDKTGTLTQGRPAVVDTVTAESFEVKEMLRLAGAVERPSEHPIGRAIALYSDLDDNDARVSDFQSITGGGVTGQVNGKHVIVGQESTLKAHDVIGLDGLLPQAHDAAGRGQTIAMVAIDGKAAGFIALADPPKPGVKAVVRALHEMKLKVILMTGDQLAAAEALAKTAGIDDVYAQVKPGEKQDRVHALQEQGYRVAMVGDGINDAPALAAADIGIAMGAAGNMAAGANSGGVDVAMEAGHVVLASGDPALLPVALKLARATMRRIYAGLFWAFIYNIILIPLAAAGLLDPMFAAAAMAASSVSVVINALWLRWSWRGG